MCVFVEAALSRKTIGNPRAAIDCNLQVSKAAAFYSPLVGDLRRTRLC